MPRFTEIVRDANQVLELEPEDLAGVVIEVILSRERGATDPVIPQQIVHPREMEDAGYPREKWREVEHAIAEAWQWLITEGLLMPAPGQGLNHGWFTLTRRGRRLKTRADVMAYSEASSLSRKLMHPVLVADAWPNFVRGAYDSAVFEAYIQVEIAVRTACGAPAGLYGLDLMNHAFSKPGPLRRGEPGTGEAEALRSLYAGAIGYAKNPVSHRRMGHQRRTAIHLIMLASHLIERLEGGDG